MRRDLNSQGISLGDEHNQGVFVLGVIIACMHSLHGVIMGLEAIKKKSK